MPTPPFTIRNLTSTPLNLRKVERFEPHSSVHDNGLQNMTKNFTTLLANATTGNDSKPTYPPLTDDAKSFKSRDLEPGELHIAPFKTVATDIPSHIKHPKEYVRLTFGAEGQMYQLDLPALKHDSTKLKPLAENPKYDFTAVYLPKHCFLALFSSARLNAWMKELKDETPLPALSIPGTHNSATCYTAAPSVRCQAVSPREQLKNGVRYFDVRVQIQDPGQPQKDGLILVHAVFPISLTGNKYLRDLVKEIRAFLDNNPSETVIMSMKREGTGSGTDAQLGRILRDHYAGDVHKWFTAPRIPTLGEARGKICLIRRFALEEGLKKEWEGKGWCIPAETWADNTPHAVNPAGTVCVQDFYEVLETQNIEKKIKYAQEQCERAACCVTPLGNFNTTGNGERPKQPFYINFLSASNFWKVGCWPEKIAKKVNPAMVDFLCRKHHEGEGPGDGSTGIVVCDWVGQDGDWDLVRCIVGMNARLEMREKGQRA
ncbi:MAG: hypothetical protein M1834_008185 [Cirrosporium novae-zelandiae]|nr:MAG: hypothetical protein M1834_008185 [Cirrosporium novae-zelandiae]